jgi:hypothetical protein
MIKILSKINLHAFAKHAIAHGKSKFTASIPAFALERRATGPQDNALL